MTTPRSDWEFCGVKKRDEPGVKCIRPAGHEGKHRGVRMEPKKVWWNRA